MRNPTPPVIDQFVEALADRQVLVINRNRKYVMVRYDMSDLQVPSATPRPGKRKRVAR
jgi:hypothetical protein